MAHLIIMPKQGQSVESCILTKWFKKKGDKVDIGDLLFSYETDKASFEEEAKVTGTFLGAFYNELDDVPCLVNVCAIGETDENLDTLPQTSDRKSSALETPISPVQEQLKHINSALDQPSLITIDHDLRISPRARLKAEKMGVDIRVATHSGPQGRIIEKDIDALRNNNKLFTSSALSQQLNVFANLELSGSGLGGRITSSDLAYKNAVPTPPNLQETEVLYDEVKVTNIRKVIAKAMHHSLSTTAQLTLNASFDATEVLKFRKKLKASQALLGDENITLNDIILYAVSRTLPNHKALNAHFNEDKMFVFRSVNLGVAVDTERGLMVPTLMTADQKTLSQISKEAKKIIKDCQAGSINPDLLRNGSFTITNLGSLGIESFTPVLNPPQTGILGVNNIIQRVREIDGILATYPAMGLSLTFDHRAIDGAPAAKFLQELIKNLENIHVLLVK